MTAATARRNTIQTRAEEMGLCEPRDKKGYLKGITLYTHGGAAEHYPTWHENTELQKKQLIEQIKQSFRGYTSLLCDTPYTHETGNVL